MQFNEVWLLSSPASHAPFTVSTVRGKELWLQWGKERMWETNAHPHWDISSIYLTDSNSSFYCQAVIHSFTRNTHTHTHTHWFVKTKPSLNSASLGKPYCIVIYCYSCSFLGLQSPTHELLIKGFIQYKQFSERRGINSASKKNIIRKCYILLYYRPLVSMGDWFSRNQNPQMLKIPI